MNAPLAQKLLAFGVTAGLFALVGPPIGGLVLWLVWFGGVLWRADAWHPIIRAIEPFSAEALMLLGGVMLLSYAIGGGLALCVGSLVGISATRSRPTLRAVVCSVIAVHAVIFLISLLEPFVLPDRLRFFPAAAEAHYLAPLSLVAAIACWGVLRALPPFGEPGPSGFPTGSGSPSERDWSSELTKAKTEAEAAHAAVYEARGAAAITGAYSGAKQAYCRAICIAEHLGETAEAQRLKDRLENMKGVFAAQFASFT